MLNLGPDEGCTGSELRALVARDWDSKKLTWFEDAGLAPLDPFGESGIGPGFDVDEDD